MWLGGELGETAGGLAERETDSELGSGHREQPVEGDPGSVERAGRVAEQLERDRGGDSGELGGLEECVREEGGAVQLAEGEQVGGWR